MTVDDEQMTPLAADAERHMRGLLSQAVFNHSARVKYLAVAQAHESMDVEALGVAALFHDAGTAMAYNGPDRFEVEGAHAAAAFLARFGWPESRIKTVWDAIALHTSPGIAENSGDLPALIRCAVLMDFGALAAPADITVDISQSLPRENVEVVLADAVVAQVFSSTDPQRKAPAGSWPGLLVAGYEHRDPLTGRNPNF